LLAPGEAFVEARIRIRRADARAIVADFELTGAGGGIVATLRGARYQPVRARAKAGLADLALRQRWIPATADLSASFGPSGELTLSPSKPAREPELSEAAALVEGWAGAAALQLARSLAADGVIDLDALTLTGRLPANRRRWAAAAFDALTERGLLERDGRTWRLTREHLPPPRAVLETLAAHHPERSAELLLAAHVGAQLEDFAGGGALAAPAARALETFAQRSTYAMAAAAALRERLEALAEGAAAGIAPRVLAIGAGPATATLAEFAVRRSIRLTIADDDALRLERVRHRFAHIPEIAFAAGLDGLADGGFDLIVSAGGLTELRSRRGWLDRLAALCASKANLLAVEPPPSLFRDFVLGLGRGAFRAVVARAVRQVAAPSLPGRACGDRRGHRRRHFGAGADARGTR
jgi:hypothetical protein